MTIDQTRMWQLQQQQQQQQQQSQQRLNQQLGVGPQGNQQVRRVPLFLSFQRVASFRFLPLYILVPPSFYIRTAPIPSSSCTLCPVHNALSPPSHSPPP
ncbi:hypothetical protein FKP32DRAFT_1589996 [Trametes sanguinea]|nr:hypothetical protein FKP32DRAFT_1589996 [Trametes sanguinea]